VLERASQALREKTGKMPRVPRPPRTPEQAADKRTEQALLRGRARRHRGEDRAVPDALKKCRVCGGTSFRTVGPGKSSEIYEYIPGYFRRLVTHLRGPSRAGAVARHHRASGRSAGPTRPGTPRASSPHLVVSKCLVVTPHYRLEQVLARTGVPVAGARSHDLFRRAGQKLERLRAPLFESLKKGLPRPRRRDLLQMTKQASKSVHLGLRRSEPHRLPLRPHARR